jgi:hypothetical protein
MAVNLVNTGVGLLGGPITSSGTISLRPPASGNIGGVKEGANIAIAADGTISIPPATTLSLGAIRIGPGLSINSSGIVSTTNNGTVTSVTPGPGLGAPATGNAITSAGTIRLLPPTTDGLSLGGVRAGTNISIAFDGTISVPGGNFIASNNEYAYNSYIWPIPNAPGPGPIPLPPCPGQVGQVLAIANQTTGQLVWNSAGTLSSVIAGPGLTVSSTASAATVSLTSVPSITPGNVGGTALIPTLAINAYGQVVSSGLANPFAGFQTPSITAPFVLVLDFDGNNTNWAWTLQGNTTIQNPLNAASGQQGSLLITQNPLSTYSITWGNSWKFANFAPFAGAGLAEVTLVQFTVVASNYIVVTGIVQNIG